MTPDELRALADAATSGPWEVDAHDDGLDVRGPEHAAATIWIHLAGPMTMGDDAVPEVKARALADARLVALAPDLARLCAELGETLGEILRQADLFEMSRNDAEAGLLDIEVVPTMAETATAALAKLAELEAR